MAIKKTLTEAVPSSTGGKVVSWNLTMKYEQGTEGEDDYYTNDKSVDINAVDKDPDGNDVNNFTAKAEKDWSKSDLEGLCPTAKWDEVFASQYDSVITNPTVNPEPNNEFAIPS
jgi:hypothetical protein